MIEGIKLYLKENPNMLIKILNYFKYKEIHKYKNDIRCCKPNGNNNSTVRIRLNEYLSADDFSLAFKGDLIGLIGEHTNMKYGEVINIIKLISDNKINKINKNKLIFDGFFEDIHIQYDYTIQIYEEQTLTNYESSWNMRFLQDKIYPSTQLKFDIGYDIENDRISIPWRDLDGNIIGIMGRLNKDIDTKYKYLPLIAFPKQYFLYGLYQNKEFIRNNRVYILESEKSVLQLDSMGYHNSVALGGNSIHSYQIEELLKLNVKEFILCFDEGLEIEVIKKSVSSIKETLFMRDDVKIGVMLDKSNKIIPKGSKASTTDLGKINWDELVENYIIMER